MEIFFVIAIGVLIVVSILVSDLEKKNPSKKHYILPGTILTGVSLIMAIVSYFTEGGWSAMGYGILFVFVAIASFLGTIIGKKLEL